MVASPELRSARIVHDARWTGAPEPVAARVLKAVTGYVAGDAVPPSWAATAAALARTCPRCLPDGTWRCGFISRREGLGTGMRVWARGSRQQQPPFTFHGCVIAAAEDSASWRIARQPWARGASPTVVWDPAGGPVVWDGRFGVSARCDRPAPAPTSTWMLAVAPYGAVRATHALASMPSRTAATLQRLPLLERSTLPLVFDGPDPRTAAVVGTLADGPLAHGPWTLVGTPLCTSVTEWLVERGWTC